MKLGGTLVAASVALIALAGCGGDAAADAPTADVACEWNTVDAGDFTIENMKAAVTISSPVALDWIEVRIQAKDADGNVLQRGERTERFEQVSANAARTFDSGFPATRGWPDDVTCTAEVTDYFEH